MGSSGDMVLFGALALFTAFFANVALGAFARAAFMGNVAEMLTLAGASLLFVAGVLLKERNAQTQSPENGE